MCVATLSEQEQRGLAVKLTTLLSNYKHITDSYIIEFFSESLWDSLPVSWQKALGDLTPPQIADLLLDREIKDRRYPSVWPLSLLALRTAAHALSFPRKAPGGHAQNAGAPMPDEFQSNQSQSSLLGHIFRKHVKPKKQHEIRRLGKLVMELCDQANCNCVVDVGSGQGHLTRFLSFGLGLRITGIEADPDLVSMATKFDSQLLLTLAKERLRSGTPMHKPGPCPHHVVGWVDPKASWEDFINQLGFTSKKDDYGLTTGLCEKISIASDQEVELEQKSYQTNSEELRATCPTDVLPSGMKPKTHTHCRSEHLSPINTIPCTGSKMTIPDANDGTKGSSNFILTGLHACGDLSSTLLRHFANCPFVQVITSVACCYMKISTEENPNPPGVIQPNLSCSLTESRSEYGYPMSDCVRGLPGHQLSYKAREGACHAIEDYLQRLREKSGLLRTHCYRAVLETIIRAAKPQLRRPGVQTVKKAHTLSFSEYARMALPRVGLPVDLPFDPVCVDAMLGQQGRVVAYFSLVLLLAPVVETLVLLDRMIFLQERGFQSKLIPLFDAAFSPRNLVLVAVKPNAVQS